MLLEVIVSMFTPSFRSTVTSAPSVSIAPAYFVTPVCTLAITGPITFVDDTGYM